MKNLLILAACSLILLLSSCGQSLRCTTTGGTVVEYYNTTNITLKSGDVVLAQQRQDYYEPAGHLTLSADTLTVQ